MTISTSTFVAATSSLLIATVGFANFPTFDDLTSGDTYHTSDAFNSSGIFVKLIPFQYWNGDWTDTGVATVSTAMWASGYQNELNTNNISALYDFAGSIGPQSEVSFLFGEYGGNGGNINVAVNGDMHNVFTFIALDGMSIGGCLFTVVSGGYGNDNGEILITGNIETLTIGGQELAVDVPYCAEAFEDLPLNAEYYNGDSFITGSVPVEVKPFINSDGTPNTGGFVRVTDLGQACGEDQELMTNNVTLLFLFDAINPIENFKFEFGEYGGNINIGINGVFRNVNDYIDLDGDVIGGVTFHVTSGGGPNGCGTVECDGVINKFLIGGQEHAIDCFEYDPADQAIPGDVNGDGLVNVEDLLAVIGAWGSNDPDADVNGDGVVDVSDILLIIAQWT